MARAIVYTSGERFPNTRLTFVRELDRVNPKNRRALFQCDCGNSLEADIAWVRHLNTTSCGCFRSELVSEKNTKHAHAVRGMASGAYRSWQAMHQRVKTDPNYSHVSVCARWSGEDGFTRFLEDMGERPEGQTIERINNSKGYEPSNCTWATSLEQAQNTRQTKQVTLNGETHSINEWCRKLGIGYHVIKQRRQRGMTLEAALTTPLDRSKQGKKK